MIIIWDWNGTLIDDVEYSRSIVNKMLFNRNKPKLSINEYKSKFCFPIKEYYRNVGFEFNNDVEYQDIVDEFNMNYRRNQNQCDLCEGARDILAYLNSKGISQYIISGMNNNDLILNVTQYGIENYFEEIYGSGTIDASDKQSLGKALLEKHNIQPKSATYIGDTLADCEFAENLGLGCIITTNGHQIIGSDCKAIRIEKLIEIKNIIR